MKNDFKKSDNFNFAREKNPQNDENFAEKIAQNDKNLKPDINSAKTSVRATKIENAENLRAKNPNYHRRPSVEIAESFVQLNIKNVIDAEKMAKMSEKELKKLAKKEAKKNKIRHPVRNAILIILCLIILAIGSAGFWWQSSVQPANALEKSTYQFEIREGASADEIANGLVKGKFIRSALAFKIYYKINGGIIQWGTHQLSPSWDLAEILAKLGKAETGEISVQIPPGLTLKELRATFKKAGFSDAEIDAAYRAKYSGEILKDKPENSTLEGYIFPETYRIYTGDKLEVLIQKSIDELQNVANENDLVAQFSARGLNFHEGLTLASIIVKEVQNPDDQKTVAGVFYNRLNIGMSLGSDVTFHYAFAQNLCSENSPNCDSAYNTRLNVGLPPGPIANPNLAALTAAAHPTASEYFYFVAGENGKTYFAKTAEEHEANIAAHCGSLCE